MPVQKTIRIFYNTDNVTNLVIIDLPRKVFILKEEAVALLEVFVLCCRLKLK